MYIKWICRKHKSQHAAHMIFHDAYLVQSYRDRKGNPRQRMIAYLGNLREMDNEFPGIERELFLLRAHQVMADLPDLTEEDHKDVLNLLQQVVHPLSNEEIMWAFHQNLRWYAHTCHQRGIPLPTIKQIMLLIEGIRATVN